MDSASAKKRRGARKAALQHRRVSDERKREKKRETKNKTALAGSAGICRTPAPAGSDQKRDCRSMEESNPGSIHIKDPWSASGLGMPLRSSVYVYMYIHTHTQYYTDRH